MNFTPYKEISFRTYQLDRPNLIDYKSLPGKGDRNSSELKQFLDDLILYGCQYTYNKKLEITLSSVNCSHEAYINITKHLCVMISCEYDFTIYNKPISKMYLTDIYFEKDKNEKFWIREIMSYKLNTGNVPGLNYYMNGFTDGLWFGGSNILPDKLPLIGISENKVFIPQRSCFLEGPHVNLYKQNFNFNFFPKPPPEDAENYESNIKKSVKLKLIN